MALGKFQGVIMPTTPMGCRMKIISLVGVGLWATWQQKNILHLFTFQNKSMFAEAKLDTTRQKTEIDPDPQIWKI